MSIEKVVVDTREIAMKLGFLVGKTILFRDWHGDATVVTPVLAVKVENTPGIDGSPCVSIHTTIGVRAITNSKRFNDIMVLGPDCSLKCLGDYTDEMGICF